MYNTEYIDCYLFHYRRFISFFRKPHPTSKNFTSDLTQNFALIIILFLVENGKLFTYRSKLQKEPYNNLQALQIRYIWANKTFYLQLVNLSPIDERLFYREQLRHPLKIAKY